MSNYAMSGKIMVVDDSAFDRLRLVKVVQSLKCEAIELAEPHNVMELAIEHQPIMIILDVVMGPPNGFEVCRNLRENPQTRHIPVLLCSVKDSQVDINWARRQGAMGYLTKPVDHEKACDFIGKQWQRFQEASQNAKGRESKVAAATQTLQQATQNERATHDLLSSYSQLQGARLGDKREDGGGQ